MRAAPHPSRNLDPDPREDKLPAWAQRKLKDARWAARDAKERLELRQAAEGTSRIWYGNLSERVYLHEESEILSPRVGFNPYGDGRLHHELSVHIVTERERIGANPAIEVVGNGPMVLRMRASNVVQIELER